MRLAIPFMMLFLTTCSTTKDVARSDPNFQDKINATVCTTAGTFIRRWAEDSVNDFDLEEFQLSTLRLESLPDDTLKEYYNTAPFANEELIMPEITLLPKDTKLKILGVHYYNVPACCNGYRIMSTVNGHSPVGKLVDISYLFSEYEPYDLKVEYAKYCD